MIIKVCGIKYRENLLDLIEESVDMVGFNFYPDSVRYVDEIQDIKGALHLIPSHISKVGVFVNADTQEIKETAKRYQLDYLQLHGDEEPQLVRKLCRKHKVIKAFQVDAYFDFQHCLHFSDCHYFLFDTKSPQYGGSGTKFNWEHLSRYDGSIPFILSGGISAGDAQAILDIDHPAFAGIDINSRFEYHPAMKDVKSISDFIYELKMDINE